MSQSLPLIVLPNILFQKQKSAYHLTLAAARREIPLLTLSNELCHLFHYVLYRTPTDNEFRSISEESIVSQN